ncbi:MAG: addiction module antitoxin [Piscirickettsiaceae bacterium]|nr:MAG: addiction module antitoxin [Piscirickettsiaceae bacterium]
MSETMNLNVRISGALKNHVSHEIQEGAYENVSEYVRDLIRRDKLKSEQLAFETLKTELQMAFSMPDSEYVELSALDIKNR